MITQADRGRGRFTNRPYGNKAVRMTARRVPQTGCRFVNHPDANNGMRLTAQHATRSVGAVREPPAGQQRTSS